MIALTNYFRGTTATAVLACNEMLTSVLLVLPWKR